ncbi:MAG: porin family protein [Flavobacteriaceae bacterium]|nr:porin family protein [Flavobacteriaceae bacterium]
MKKIFLILIVILSFSLTAEAQNSSDNAIGLRLGDNDGLGAEVNYQRGLSGNNRLEFGLGWRTKNDVNALKLTGLYQWVFNLDGNFNWYVGAGGGLASISFDNDFPGDPDNETSLFVAGDIGIEYDFDIPIIISLDFRPELGFGDYNDDIDFDIAFGIRYQF